MVFSLPAVRMTVGDFEQDLLGTIAIVGLVHVLGVLVITRRSLQDGFAKPRSTSIDEDQV